MGMSLSISLTPCTSATIGELCEDGLLEVEPGKFAALGDATIIGETELYTFSREEVCIKASLYGLCIYVNLNRWRYF